MTLLAEVEALVNTCPLTCVHKELGQLCSYPLYFLVDSFNNAIPFSAEENYSDSEYFPTLDSTQVLLQYWKTPFNDFGGNGQRVI